MLSPWYLYSTTHRTWCIVAEDTAGASIGMTSRMTCWGGQHGSAATLPLLTDTCSSTVLESSSSSSRLSMGDSNSCAFEECKARPVEDERRTEAPSTASSLVHSVTSSPCFCPRKRHAGVLIVSWRAGRASCMDTTSSPSPSCFNVSVSRTLPMRTDTFSLTKSPARSAFPLTVTYETPGAMESRQSGAEADAEAERTIARPGDDDWRSGSYPRSSTLTTSTNTSFGREEWKRQTRDKGWRTMNLRSRLREEAVRPVKGALRTM
mmetsp:Transcript_41678/g.67615  ORF Transcript_41678/g.67615 Transcript_41678/m.67615 type:complete len:264 (-) Transcript_41678:881-1672(-)